MMIPIWEALQEALDAVAIERARQEDLVASGKFPHTARSLGLSDSQKLAVLVDQLGEVATEIVEHTNQSTYPGADVHLRKGLLQVAAVAVAWIEALDEGSSDA